MTEYWVTLKVAAYKTMLVEAEDEKEARRLALAQTPLDVWADWEPGPSETPEVIGVEED